MAGKKSTENVAEVEPRDLAEAYLKVAMNNWDSAERSIASLNAKLGILLPASLVIIGLTLEVPSFWLPLKGIAVCAIVVAAAMLAYAFMPASYFGGERLPSLYERAEAEHWPMDRILMQIASTVEHSADENIRRVRRRGTICRFATGILLLSVMLISVDYFLLKARDPHGGAKASTTETVTAPTPTGR